MTTQEIVGKLWNLCNVLRDDGITYHQYVTELTYILFLKMASETGAEEKIPKGYRWENLSTKSGIELKKFYKALLNHLGENCTGRIREIYQGASSNIDEPKNLEKIIASIDALDWDSAREAGLGNLYEGLLDKNANEKKSGAGQYFTPRALIDVIVRLMKPQAGERCNDPACGTFGFMIAAAQYVRDHTDDFFDLSEAEKDFEKTQAFTGCELVHDTHRLALMNAMLHGLDGRIIFGDLFPREDVKTFVTYSAAVVSFKCSFKIGEMFTAERIGYTKRRHIRSQIIEPDFAGIANISRAASEKQDISLDSFSIENSRRQTQDGMQVTFVHEVNADSFAVPVSKKNVVR